MTTKDLLLIGLLFLVYLFLPNTTHAALCSQNGPCFEGLKIQWSTGNDVAEQNDFSDILKKQFEGAQGIEKIPSNYQGPLTKIDCMYDLAHCLAAQDSCGIQEDKRVYGKQDETFCNGWSTLNWSSVDQKLLSCEKFLWSQSAELPYKGYAINFTDPLNYILSDDHGNDKISTPDSGKWTQLARNYSMYALTNGHSDDYTPPNHTPNSMYKWAIDESEKPTKPYTKAEACNRFLSNDYGKWITATVDANNCKNIAIECKGVYEKCGLLGPKNEFSDPDLLCKQVFNGGKNSKNVGLFDPCLKMLVLDKDAPPGDIKWCKEFITASIYHNECKCQSGGMSFDSHTGVKTKTDCCNVCKTLKVNFENESLECPTILNKPLVENCQCTGLHALGTGYSDVKFSMGGESDGKVCCQNCRYAKGDWKGISTLNNVKSECGFIEKVGDQAAINLVGIQKFQSPLRAGIVSPQTFIGNLIKVLLGIVGSLAFAMVVWGGFQWMTSAGSSERIKSGQQTVMWAVFGLVAIFISYGVVNVLLGLG